MTQPTSPLAYHETTKHHFHRYARSAGYMDWANQPNPFRTYPDVSQTALPLTAPAHDIAYAELFAPRQTAGQPLSLDTVGTFLYCAMALSAWKAAGGSRWSLRVNPSSGNLHPTECYPVLPPMDSFPGGVCHYNVFTHALEQRIQLPPEAWRICASHFKETGFLVGLSAIYWRESWKYGERAFRYCQLDAGHAVAALAIAARVNGWRLTCLNGAGDHQIEQLLGLDRTAFMDGEREVPDLLCWVSPASALSGPPVRTVPAPLVQLVSEQPVRGRPNPLSRQRVDWPIIDAVSRATRNDATRELECRLPDVAVQFPPPKALRAVDIIRKRRSASAYNPRQTISRQTFLSLLDRTMPRIDLPPFDAGPMSPAVELLLFVHRVDEVAPGIYILLRSGTPVDHFKKRFASSFEWQLIEDGFPLWLLKNGDVTYDALEVSCHQEIAGHGAFAVAMLAPLQRMAGALPCLYRHLHWECGMIGQMLYLEAEAHGIRGTGIGCFFDDPVNALLGMESEALNSLYHFTVGHPLEDSRIQTLPAYHHLQR